MSLILNMNTDPQGTTAYSNFVDGWVCLRIPHTAGDDTFVEISPDDFAELVKYFFINTDLIENADPRMRLREWVSSLKVTEGLILESND